MQFFEPGGLSRQNAFSCACAKLAVSPISPAAIKQDESIRARMGTSYAAGAATTVRRGLFRRTHAAPRQFELEKLLGFRRYDDAVQVIRPAIEFERRADVKSEIRRRLLQDLARR